MDLKQALQEFSCELKELKTRLPGQTVPAYYKPLTLAKSDRIQQKIEAGKVQSDGAKLVITLVECLLDADGKRIFDAGDKNWLQTQVPQNVLIDLVNEISGVMSIEDAGGN